MQDQGMEQLLIKNAKLQRKCRVNLANTRLKTIQMKEKDAVQEISENVAPGGLYQRARDAALLFLSTADRNTLTMGSKLKKAEGTLDQMMKHYNVLNKAHNLCGGQIAEKVREIADLRNQVQLLQTRECNFMLARVELEAMQLQVKAKEAELERREAALDKGEVGGSFGKHLEQAVVLSAELASLVSNLSQLTRIPHVTVHGGEDDVIKQEPGTADPLAGPVDETDGHGRVDPSVM